MSRASGIRPTNPIAVPATSAAISQSATALRRQAASHGAKRELALDMASGARGGGVNVGVGGGRFGGHTSVGAGVGVDISPTRKHARAIAIYVMP